MRHQGMFGPGREQTYAFDVPLVGKHETSEQKDDRWLLAGVRSGLTETGRISVYAGIPGGMGKRCERAIAGLRRLQLRGLVKRTEKGWEKV